MKYKIFHFILDHRVGGPHVYVKNFSQMLDANFESSIITTLRNSSNSISLFNLRHFFRWLYPFEVVLNVITLCWKFRKYNTRKHVIFDVHGVANLAPIIAAFFLRIPLVWHFHETVRAYITLANIGKLFVSRLSHQIVVVAKMSAKIYGLKDAVHIPGAVDPEFWANCNRSSRVFNSLRPLRIITVGNLNPLKGIDVLLAALDKFEKPWHLLIVGAELNTYSDYVIGLHKYADLLRSPTRQIQFEGWRTPEQIRDHMSDCDIFVLPSRSEACPIALLEAMSAGCVCIATDVGDVRDILETSNSGIVVPSDCPLLLTEAIFRISKTTSEQLTSYSQTARETIYARYTIEMQAKKHLEIYGKLVLIDRGMN